MIENVLPIDELIVDIDNENNVPDVTLNGVNFNEADYGLVSLRIEWEPSYDNDRGSGVEIRYMPGREPLREVEIRQSFVDRCLADCQKPRYPTEKGNEKLRRNTGKRDISLNEFTPIKSLRIKMTAADLAPQVILDGVNLSSDGVDLNLLKVIWYTRYSELKLEDNIIQLDYATSQSIRVTKERKTKVQERFSIKQGFPPVSYKRK